MPLDVSKYYLFRASNGASVLCLRGDGPPQIMGGGARWSVVNRPRRTGIVQWDGDDPYTMQVPILLDGWADKISIEKDVSRLNQMMHSQGDLVPPVTVFIDGALPVKGAKWVIQNIDWGDAVIWSVVRTAGSQTGTGAKGFRLRQDAVVRVLQFLPETVLQLNRPSGATTPHKVIVGETIYSLAAKFNVTVDAIKKANPGLRDGKAIKTNDTIKIPPSTDRSK